MLTTLTRSLVAISAAALLLGGCASVVQDNQEVVDTGPDFLAEGRLSIRKTGRPNVLASFIWARGYLATGWTERITLTDNNGLRILRVVSSPESTIATTPHHSYRSSSLRNLLDREIGLDIPPSSLAYWLSNEHDGKPLPDKLRLENTQIEVLERASNERPVRMRIIHEDVIMVVAVTHYT